MRNHTVRAALALFASLIAGNVRAVCNVTTLTCGSSSGGNMGGSSCTIGGTPGARFSFAGTSGQVVSLTVSANSDFHTFWLVLYSPSGAQLTSVLDEPAEIYRYTLPSSGTYSVEARLSSSSDSTGYTMSLSCDSPTTTPGVCSYTGTIHIGGSQAGQLTSADTACSASPTTYAKAYKIPVIAGDVFAIDYQTSYPGRLEIDGPDTSGVTKRTTAAGTLSTMYVAPSTGDVTLFVASNGTTPLTGSFTVTLTPVAQPACGKLRAVKH